MSSESAYTAPKFSIRTLSLALSNQLRILKNISIDIPHGQVTSLIGPSGSGKSTLLRCLNRLWEPPKGTLFLDDEDITQIDVLALRRRVGMLMQSAALFDGTVADNVRYGPALRGETLTASRVSELLEMASLDPALARKSADALSIGQAQRVSLARTLANEPEVLLLDEPTSALDPAATRRVEESILHLRNTTNLTVVWVSHSLEQVKRTAENIILLLDGEIAEYGPADHLLSGIHHHLTDDFAAGELETHTVG